MRESELCVVLGSAGESNPDHVGRYSLDLTRHLIESAPRGWDVRAFVPSSPSEEYDRIELALPGLAGLEKSALDGRQLAAVWQHGFTRILGAPMVHAPSMFAPLYRHDRINNPGAQIVVTVHETTAWSDPDLLTSATVARHRRLGRRIERYADAIVVTTHAAAHRLAESLDLGERIRVIAAAPSTELRVPPDAADRRTRLYLPDRYVLNVSPLDKSSGVDDLLWAMADARYPEIPLVLARTAGSGGVPINIEKLVTEARLVPERVLVLDDPIPDDLASVYAGASLLVALTRTDSFETAALGAMSIGTPVIHSDTPALLEVCADAGLIVERAPASDYRRRLVDAISRGLDDEELAHDLCVRGHDRARAFSWQDSAEKTWQLHADL